MHSRRCGFTLIELLVVVAIIAILAAILFPVLLGAKKRVLVSQCLSNLKQLSQAIRCYADDNHGIMPYDWPGKANWCGCPAASGWVYPQIGQIWRYVRNVNIYRCPSDLGRAAVWITSMPAGMTRIDYPLSYSMNSNLGRQNADAFSNATKRMLLIHENRGESKADFAINDGAFVPGGQDVPGCVHYDGSTLAYLDGHAAWKPRTKLVVEASGW